MMIAIFVSRTIIDDSNHASTEVCDSIAHFQELWLVLVEDGQGTHSLGRDLETALTTVEAHNGLEKIAVHAIVLPLQAIDLAAQVLLQLRKIL